MFSRIRVETGRTGAELQGMFDRGRDLTPVMRGKVGPDQIKSILRNFEAGGRPERWAPLKASSRRSWLSRYKRGGAYRTRSGKPNRRGLAAMAARRPLWDTGTMARSVRVYRAWARGVQMATGGNAPYAPFHQFGTKTIPARPFMVWQDEDLARHQGSIRDFIMGG